MKHSNLLVFVTVFCFLICFNPQFAFDQDLQNTIEVKGIDETYLKYPWAGGMNSIQFGAIDLNMDGLNDLFAFDRNGNRKMCFINNGVFNKVDFSYAPAYNKLLPDFSDWVIFADYNGDGKVDIFTYSPGWAGILVYKNISDNILKFELVASPYLETFQENGYVNLLVTNVDYPGIADIDDDGDLDILSFWGLGSFVNFHRNMSMEKYGNADSLDYRLEEYCWGSFAENDESNELYLDTCFTDQKVVKSPLDDFRHTGSTLLLIDLDNDTVKDLLLGDVDFPTVYALKNDGKLKNAHIGSVDTLFPLESKKISLFSFPVTAYIDVNNDLKNDLLVSPFDPGLTVAENKNSVWLYQNSGTNDGPFFNFTTKNFIQSEMIDRGSGAYPVLFDWNKDGLMDLMVGDYGYYMSSYYDDFLNLHSVYQSRIGYYQNTGTAQQPRFQLMDDDVADLSTLETTGLIPAFEDFDKDGNIDLLTGSENGMITLVMNKGNDEFEVVSENYAEIDVGEYSAPQLFDLDKDGLIDLIIGEKGGNLNYYKNTGTDTSPEFEFVTDSLGKINVTDYGLSWDGYSVPWFFRMTDDTTRLVVGSEQGVIYYYTNIDGNLEGAFTESNLNTFLDTTGLSFDQGARTAAVVGDLFDNSRPEMIVGNYSGGMEYFNGSTDVSPGYGESTIKPANQVTVFPNPAMDEIHFIDNSSNQKIEFSITSLLGSKQQNLELTKHGGGHFSINVSTLPNGIYILLISGENKLSSGKFIIQK